jgi:hypothetical protein
MTSGVRWIRISNSPLRHFAPRNDALLPHVASCFPSPREAAGRDQGWGVAPRMLLSANLPIDPPPPTPPHHALTRAEGGEKTHLRNLAAQSARALPEISRPLFRGRRECRAPDAPAATCAMGRVERTRVSQVTPESPGIPYAMVLTASFVLSPATGLSCHRRP